MTSVGSILRMGLLILKLFLERSPESGARKGDTIFGLQIAVSATRCNTRVRWLMTIENAHSLSAGTKTTTVNDFERQLQTFIAFYTCLYLT